jgi:aminopeptidase N
MVETDELPNAELESTVAGFASLEQRDLLTSYVDRYFASVEELYRTRSSEMGQLLITGLYPMWATDQGTVDRTDAYLRDEQPGAALRRLLTESRDALARALRSRARDTAS